MLHWASFRRWKRLSNEEDGRGCERSERETFSSLLQLNTVVRHGCFCGHGQCMRVERGYDIIGAGIPEDFVKDRVNAAKRWLMWTKCPDDQKCWCVDSPEPVSTWTWPPPAICKQTCLFWVPLLCVLHSKFNDPNWMKICILLRTKQHQCALYGVHTVKMVYLYFLYTLTIKFFLHIR